MYRKPCFCSCLFSIIKHYFVPYVFCFSHVVLWFRLVFNGFSMVSHGFPQSSSKFDLLIASCRAAPLRPHCPILHSSSAICTASRCRSVFGGCGVALLRDLACGFKGCQGGCQGDSRLESGWDPPGKVWVENGRTS